MYKLSQEDKRRKGGRIKQRERQEEGRIEACYIFSSFELKHSLQEAGCRLIKPRKEMDKQGSGSP